MMPLQFPTQLRGHHLPKMFTNDSVKKVDTDRSTNVGKMLAGINIENFVHFV